MAWYRFSWRRLLLALLALLVLLLVLLLWLLASPSGSRWLLSTVSGQLDELTLESSEGSLWNGMRLHGVVWQDPAIDVRIDQLEFEAHWWPLMRRTMDLKQLHISGVVVTLAPAVTEDPAAEVPEMVLPNIELPVRILIDDLNIQALTVQQRDEDQAVMPVLELARITGRIKASAQRNERFTLDSLTVAHEQGDLQLNGWLDLANWQFDLAQQTQWRMPEGRVASSGTLSGTPMDLSLQAHALIDGPSVQAKADLAARANLLEPGGQLTVNLADSTRVHFDQQQLQVDRMQLRIEGDSARLVYDIDGEGQLALTHVDPAENLSSADPVSGTARSVSDSASPVVPWSLQSVGQLDLASLLMDVEQLLLDSSLGQVNGSLVASLSEPLRLELDASLQDIDSDALMRLVGSAPLLDDLEGLQLSSDGLIDGAIKGRFNWQPDASLDWQQRLTATLDTLSLSGKINGLPLQVEGSLSLRESRLDVPGLSVVYADNALTVRGQGDTESLDVAVELDAGNLAQLSPTLSGSLQSSLHGSGSLETPRLRIDLQGQQLRLDETLLKQVSLAGEIEWDVNRQQLLGSTVNIDLVDLVMDQNRIDTLHLDWQGTPAAHAASVQLAQQDQTLSMQIEGSLDESMRQWQGQLGQLQLKALEPVGQWSLNEAVNLSASAQRLDLDRACLRSEQHQGSLCLEVQPLGPPDPSVSAAAPVPLEAHRVAFSADRFSLQALKPLLPPAMQLDGWLNGQGEARFDQSGIDTLDADLRTSDATVTVRREDDEDLSSPLDLNIQLTQAQNRFDAEVLLALAEHGQITGAVSSSFSAADAIPLSGDFTFLFRDAEYLAALSEEISQISGQLEGRLQVEGTLDAPVLTLSMALDDGQIGLTRTGTALQQLKVLADLDEQGQITLEVSTASGGGTVRLTGQGQYRDRQDWQMDARLTGEAFEVLRLPEIQLSTSPALDIAVRPESLSVTGEVDVSSATVQFKQLPETAVSLSSDVVIHRDEAPQSELEGMQLVYDIQVNLDEPIAFNAVGLSTRIQGDLRLRSRSDGTLWSTGALTLSDGVYRIYGQALTIDEGRLMFNGPISNPSLDVKATREASNSTDLAGIQLGGTVNNLSSSLYSEPSMPDLDVLSILLTGRRGGTGGELSTDDLARAVVLLGLKDSTNLLSQFRDALGIDVLNVRGAKDQSETALEAGKYLNEDLYVGYALGIFNRTGVLLLRYQINRRLSLESEYGERQSFDLIYSIEKKR